MSSGVSIPGVTDKYKTNDLVDSLMAVERVPLTREQEALETYQNQQSAWRSVNQKMSALRESVKTLYSFDNPFNNRLATSSDEAAVTVEAGREADYGSFKLDVVHPATADRFLSGNIDKNMNVPQGTYTFEVGGKTIDYNWRGGKLNDFINGLNRRGTNVVKASLIGISPTKSSLVIESLIPGTENRLIFKNDALTFAKDIDMIQNATTETSELSSNIQTYKTITTTDSSPQNGMPAISKNNATVSNGQINLDPRSGFEIPFTEEMKSVPGTTLEFTFSESQVKDITEELNNFASTPDLPDAGSLYFHGINIENNPDETSYAPKQSSAPKTPLKPISSDSIFYIKNEYGMEVELESSAFTKDPVTGETKVSVKLSDYPGATGLVVRNSNTGKAITMSVPFTYDASKALGFEPKHAITTADDAVIKYEGITITRSTNDIDDVVPHITLHLHQATDKTATINVEPDKESAKEALINFVGRYNQVIAEINILTSNKPEIVSELEYLSDSEIETANERLGMFFSDFTLTNGKSSLARLITANYRFADEAVVTMLSQIGISTNASSGTSASYNAAQMRGYLEIDEKKLDASLDANLNDIKNLFGFDSDGDLIIDSGIGYLLDRQLTSWVQSGGIISTKTAALDTKIDSSTKKIASLEEQLDAKEAELRAKYATMEGTLNSLESQQSTISNFTNSLNNSGR